MIDPDISLAFSIYSNPGVYAILLGSGISRSAEIPTGWDVVRDLIRKVAALKNLDSGEDPERWYRDTFGVGPDYSTLLDELAKTPEERSQCLRAYFEPTEEQRSEGVKTPTVAHRAIADLVKSGFIRVIVTTNFDRLMETALADVGIAAQVISTPDAVKGTLPLSHAKCLIVKVNGDYLDSRIKNTRLELETYDPALDLLLDRIFDEFGLIVCGWSGDWDLALARAIERCSSRRFTTYWLSRGEPTTAAGRLISTRSAVEIQIDGADTLFRTIREKVLALVQLGGRHPLSPRIATTQVKRYIVKPQDKIVLHDMVLHETEVAYSRMTGLSLGAGSVPDFAAETARRLELYESCIEVLLPILITGCYWGRNRHAYLWEVVLKRLGKPPSLGSGLSAWIALQLYPATVLFYAGGISAIAARRFDNLATLFKTPISAYPQQTERLAAVVLNQANVLVDGLYNAVPGFARRLTPLSDYLFQRLRSPLAEVVPVESDYENAFLLFQYLQGVFIWSIDPGWAPVGRPRWKASTMYTPDGPTSPTQPIIREAAGVLFPRGIDEYGATKAAYDSWAIQNTRSWH